MRVCWQCSISWRGCVPLVQIHHTCGHVGEEKVSSTLLESLAESENDTDKDRFPGEKHANVFNISFMWHRSLHEERKLKETDRSGLCWWAEEWTAVEECGRLWVWGWCDGETEQRCSDSSWWPFARMRAHLSSGCREGTSPRRSKDLFQGRTRVRRSEWPFYFCHLPELLQLKICQNDRFWGGMSWAPSGMFLLVACSSVKRLKRGTET